MNNISDTQKILKETSNAFSNEKESNTGTLPPLQQETSEQADAQQNVEEQNSELQELIDLAVAAFENGRISQCLEYWDLVRKKFPTQPQGYIQGGFTALKLQEIALAENLATQAIEKFPQALQAFRLYAEVAMSSCAFELALSRWALVRRHFPTRPMGYIRAFNIALELGKMVLAEKLLALAEKKFPNESAVQKLRLKLDKAVRQTSIPKGNLTLSDLLDIAEKDLRMGLFQQAFMHFKLAMKHIPEKIRSFSGAADAAMKLQDYLRVERIAKDMITRFPLNIQGYQYQIQSLEAREEWAEALAKLEDIKKKFPENPYAWQKCAEIQLKTGNYKLADAEMKEAISLFPSNLNIFIYFAELPLFATDPEIWRDAIERCLTACQKFPSQYYMYLRTLNICHKLIFLQDNEEYRDTYHHIFNQFLHHFKHEDIGSFTDKKIAIYARSVQLIKYILPVLKFIPPSFIDIIIQNDTPDAEHFIKKFGLSDYSIYYGDENVKKYKYVIGDARAIAINTELQNSGCSFIGYTHASDAAATGGLKHLSLAIFESQNQMTNSRILSCAPLPDGYTLPARANYKCEICHTGLYHIGEFLERRHEKKSQLKAELAEQLGIDIPQDKPLIFLLEDELCHIGQIAYAANHMAEYATVIYKSLLPVADPRLAKFSSKVHMLRGPLAPNLPRFAADFVCCGYMSGSFTTSVMLGQNVLPYYSRLLRISSKPHPHFPPKTYDTFKTLPEACFRSAANIIYAKFYEEGRLLDLAKADSFKNAIQGTEYREWYQSVLPSLQKEAFGDYLLDGAPQKTADYIMRFVKEGTLGKDCTAVYLKKKDFV